MSRLKHVVFCGGGSGGHLSPAVAIAEELLSRVDNVRLTFLTSARQVDTLILESAKLPANSINHDALPIISSRNVVRFAFRTVTAVRRCRRLFRHSLPDLIISTGGFASVPGVIAARSMGIPIAILEPNVVPGRANRWLNRWARTTFTGWPMNQGARENWHSPLTHTGIPLSHEFAAPPQDPHRMAANRTLLVIGGSLGASQLNQLVTTMVSDTNVIPAEWNIVHQTGTADEATVRQAYAKCGRDVRVLAFISDMPRQLQQAGLVVSRAGAVTLAELAAAAAPSILVPLASAADGHQLANASYFESVGAAHVVVPEDSGDKSALEAVLGALLEDPDERSNMCAATKNLRCVDAAERIVDWMISNCSIQDKFAAGR